MDDESSFEEVKKVINNKSRLKDKIVKSFVDKRSRNSFMNSFLQDAKRNESCIVKQKAENMDKLKTEVSKEDFFYNSFNKTIDRGINVQRFSKAKGRVKTQESETRNLFAIKTKSREKTPHGVRDIVNLVRLKVNFQKRFRKDKKSIQLFDFDDKDVPLYIKSRFKRITT